MAEPIGAELATPDIFSSAIADAIVYIATRGGAHYHRTRRCIHLAKAIRVRETRGRHAEARGLDACGACA